MPRSKAAWQSSRASINNAEAIEMTSPSGKASAPSRASVSPYVGVEAYRAVRILMPPACYIGFTSGHRAHGPPAASARKIDDAATMSRIAARACHVSLMNLSIVSSNEAAAELSPERHSHATALYHHLVTRYFRYATLRRAERRPARPIYFSMRASRIAPSRFTFQRLKAVIAHRRASRFSHCRLS